MTSPVTPREPTPEALRTAASFTWPHYNDSRLPLSEYAKGDPDCQKLAMLLDRFAEQRVAAAQKVIEAAREWDIEAAKIVPEFAAHSYDPEEIALHEAIVAYDSAERGDPDTAADRPAQGGGAP